VAIPVVAAASFLAGFGVAELTGVRAIGGLVLLAGGAWGARAAFRLAGGVAATALVIAAVALFVVSHLLGHLIGAWPAVVVSAALVAMVAAAILARAQGGEGEGSQEEDVVRGRLRPE
jgi:hypothetical protein